MFRNDLARLTDALLDAARAAGADAADAVADDGASTEIAVRRGTLEQAERSESVDIGLRVLIGRRQAVVSASDTSAETMRRMAERAVAMAREAPEDPGAGLAEPDQLATDTDAGALDLWDPSPEPAPAELEEMARRTEAAAMGVAGVTKIDVAAAAHNRQWLHLATTNGFSAGYGRSATYLSCSAISGEGVRMERDAAFEGRTHAADLPSPEEVGARAGARAAARAGARRAPTGPCAVLYDERISAGLIGHLLAAINGTAIVRGASWARDLMEQPVLPDALSIHEEPHRPRIGGSQPFDAEGLPARDRTLVDDGRLKGWILDLASARKLGLAPTANASRRAGSAPSPSAGNMRLTPGRAGRDELMRDMGRGLLVTSLIGSTINPNTGDYSRGASGFWVENGEIAYPVGEITIAGNLKDMLRRIVPANDAQAHKSRLVPSLLVDGMTLAGE